MAHDGLFRLEQNRWKRVIASPDILGIFSLVENEQGTGVVFITLPPEKRGLWEWKSNSLPSLNPEKSLEGITTLDISYNGQVAAAYRLGEVRLRTGKHWSEHLLQHPAIRKIEFLKFRTNGDLWIGTPDGLFLYKSSKRWTHWKLKGPDLKNTINEILRTRDGALWLATDGGLVVQSSDGTIQTIDHINNRPVRIITGLAEDVHGNVWISSGGGFDGTYRWDGLQWTYFNIADDSDGVQIHKIRTDLHGRPWFLGLSKRYKEPGAFVYDHGTFTHWGVNEGLLNGRVYSFAEGLDGALWFGTLGELSRWKHGRWTHWTMQQGLINNRIFALAIDHHNRVWFSHQMDNLGLGFIDEHDSVHYLISDDPMGGGIWELKVSRDGKLWIATRDGGVKSYDIENGIWATYDSKTGLGDTPIWPILPLENKVYVGTYGNGIAILNLDETRQPVSRLTLDKPIVEGNSAFLRWRPYSFWGEPPPQNILTRYQIDNAPWSPWNNTHETKLNNLPVGDHSIEVQARGLFGDYNPIGQRVSFSIARPLYQRPIFSIPVGVLSLVVLYLGIVLLLRKRKHDRAIQESEAKLRTVTETTASAIFIYQDNAIRFVNSSATLLTGFSREELLRMKFLDIIHPDDHEFMKGQEIAWEADASSSHRCELKVVTKHRGECWIDLTAGQVEYEGTLATLGTAVDISERKFAEQRLLEHQDMLRSLASELALTEERERRRMATDLHDSISQTLAFCQIKLAALKSSKSPSESAELIQEINALIEQSVDHAHSLTFELSPPVLYELSFDEAIVWLTEQFQEQHKIQISFNDDGEHKSLGEDIRVVLFRAVREALVNIVKHAHTQRAGICMQKIENMIEIVIEDAGVGFNIANNLSHAKRNGGFGLFNIRERLTRVGGSLVIESHIGKGTTVTLRAPLKESQITK